MRQLRETLCGVTFSRNYLCHYYERLQDSGMLRNMVSCSLDFPSPFCLSRARGGEGLPEQVSLWAYYYYSEWAPKEWNLQLSLNLNTRLNSEDKHWAYETRYKHMDQWILSIFLSMLLLFLIMWLALIIYNRNLPQAANILTEDFSINKKKKKNSAMN